MDLKQKRIRKIVLIILIAAVAASFVIARMRRGPEGKPVSVTMTIECEKAAPYVKSGKYDRTGWIKYVPEDYMILKKTSISCREGDTVYDVFKKTCRKRKISFVNKSGAMGKNSVYISSINYLSEKDLGKYSGWTYYVNGKMPDAAANGVKLKDGDDIVWSYSITE
ncbi:MAG: DUF4430 domain-containing protein [Anaerovoracaceae bacterium]